MIRLMTLCLLISTASISMAQSALLKANSFYPQIKDFRSVDTGDINGDGMSDLLVVTDHNAGVLIYLNDGSKQFYLPNNQLNTGRAYDGLLQDFDGDGDSDIWVALNSESAEERHHLFLNDGTGVFEKNQLTVNSSDTPFFKDDLLSGDLDNNGSVDVVRVLDVDGSSLDAVFVYLNDGSAGFQEVELPINLFSSSQTHLADFNEDGYIDIWSIGLELKVFLNDGEGGFNQELAVDPGVSFPFSVEYFDPILSIFYRQDPYNAVLADIDNDGDTDIQIFSSLSYLPRFLNNGDGTFTRLFSPPIIGDVSTSIQSGVFIDFDNDQDLDLWLTSASNNNSRIVVTDENGEVDQFADTIELDENRINSVITDDFDNDGDIDVVTVGFSGLNFWNKTGQQFQKITQQTINKDWGEYKIPTLVDMNNDAKKDLLVAGNGIKTALGNGRGGFGEMNTVYEDDIYRLLAADFNSDGFDDLSVVTRNGTQDILINDKNNGFQAQSLPLESIWAYSLSSGDIDADGDLDLVVQDFAGPIRLYLNDGVAGFVHAQSLSGVYRSANLVDLDQNGIISLIAQTSSNRGLEQTLGLIQYDYIDGSLEKGRFAEIGPVYRDVVFFDHDADGDLDILTTASDNGSYILLQNNPSEFEQLAFPFTGAASAVDINQDGAMDFVLGSGDIYLNNNSGFDLLNISTNTSTRNNFALGDVDGDTDIDMVLFEDKFGVSTLTNTTIDQDFSGLWFDPANSGHGIQAAEIVINDAVQVQASWYVYNQGEQMWLTGVGPVDGNSAEVEFYISSGPDFGVNYLNTDLNLEYWGTGNITFLAQNSINFSWDGRSYGFDQGNMNLTRLAGIKATSKTSQQLNSCHSGSWFSPSESGHGYMVQLVEIDGQQQMVITWYTYLAGEQYWLTAIGPTDGLTADLTVQVTTGASFPPDFLPEDVTYTDWGRMTFNLLDDNHAKVTWESDLPGISAGELEVERLTLIDRYQCH